MLTLNVVAFSCSPPSIKNIKPLLKAIFTLMSAGTTGTTSNCLVLNFDRLLSLFSLWHVFLQGLQLRRQQKSKSELPGWHPGFCSAQSPLLLFGVCPKHCHESVCGWLWDRYYEGIQPWKLKDKEDKETYTRRIFSISKVVRLFFSESDSTDNVPIQCNFIHSERQLAFRDLHPLCWLPVYHIQLTTFPSPLSFWYWRFSAIP